MSAPEGLTALEYARHILEFALGWPAKGNIELVADCLTSISKAKKLPIHKAHGYMERAIGLAKAQGIDIDRFFFMEGKYTSVRPTKSEDYVVTTQKRYEACAEHGCMSGWVYAGKGVVRCQKCVREK